MNEPDPRRLDALKAALVPLTMDRPAIGEEASRSGGDVPRVATTHIDELLRRVAALTGVVGDADARGWDEVDQLAAQLLLADLGAIASTTRALNVLAASRLAGARADLQAAGVDVQRVLKEASGS